MIEWIKNLVGAEPDEAASGIDADLMKELRRSLRACETLYMDGAHECAQVCPDLLPDGPDKFSELMMDLHRGLIVKIFVTIAQADRTWHTSEQAAAFVVLRHVWGVTVDGSHIADALEKASDLAESLQWESLLGPFLKYGPLIDQQSSLLTQATRIANFVAKADGKVTEPEARALKSIHLGLQVVFASGVDASRRSSATVERASSSGRTQSAAAVAPTPERKTATRKRASENQDARSASAPSAPRSRQVRQRMLDEALAELHELIGLSAVKKDVNELIAFLKIQAERAKHDLPLTPISLHAVFQGNPGTGKTTVARIIGKALGGLGIVAKGHTIETDRSGLVAKFAGQTGPQVNEQIDKALDGVLFIDEAYSLVADEGEDQYGDEAVQVLLKRMEDDRQRLVVILAGYPAPMQQMLQSNPGLSSRFQRTFDFPDYTVDELLQVFDTFCRKNEYVLSPPARQKLLALLTSAVDARDEHFGNARLARNLFESAIRRLASRIITISPLTKAVLTTLEAEDLESAQ